MLIHGSMESWNLPLQVLKRYGICSETRQNSEFKTKTDNDTSIPFNRQKLDSMLNSASQHWHACYNAWHKKNSSLLWKNLENSSVRENLGKSSIYSLRTCGIHTLFCLTKNSADSWNSMDFQMQFKILNIHFQRTMHFCNPMLGIDPDLSEFSESWSRVYP